MAQLHMSVLRHIVILFSLFSLNAGPLLTMSGPASITVIPAPLFISLLQMLGDRAVRSSLGSLHMHAQGVCCPAAAPGVQRSQTALQLPVHPEQDALVPDAHLWAGHARRGAQLCHCTW